MRLPLALLLLTLGSAAQAQVMRVPAADDADSAQQEVYEFSGIRSKRIDLGTTPQASNQLAPVTFNQPVDTGSEAPTDSRQPLRLAPPDEKRPLKRPVPQTPTGALTTVIASLAVVLGLFFVVVWFTRRAFPKAAATLPTEVVEVMGRAALAGRQHLEVVRFGNKLLLVSVGPQGATTLSEISEPEEFERVAGLCREGQPGSISATFRQVLSQFANEPAPGGFLGDDSAETQTTPATDARRRSLQSLEG